LRHRGAKNINGDDMSDTIVQYYSRFDEKNRLQNRHSLERIRTQEIISRCLNSNKASILDIGGAAGIYSFWLAGLGHKVDLIDLTPKHIEEAKKVEQESKIRLNSMTVGNACKLPYKDDSYEIVLLMGPMYHILDKEQRIKALVEAKRVLKQNGLIFVAAISRFASMFDAFINNLIDDEDFYPIMLSDIECGKHTNPTNKLQYFTDAYFHQPSELKNEIDEAGIQCLTILPVEGLGNSIPQIENRIKNERYKQKLLTAIRKTENEPSILGVGSHFLGIGKKK
jgi:2-polyprenyl-3-methyl-5-hydroxy-6-metoxy-1,4-benzoquinol methylase